MSARIPSAMTGGLRYLLAVLLLGAGFAAHGQSCTFASPGGALDFPPLDQSNPVTVAAFININVKCVPAGVSPTWNFSGANGSAPLQMKHLSLTAFIPYSIAATFVSNSGANEVWRVTGTILGANYQNAPIGSYSDILTATVLP
jgi:hypothetical protein